MNARRRGRLAQRALETWARVRHASNGASPQEQAADNPQPAISVANGSTTSAMAATTSAVARA
jgi:hypothetical protein